MRYIPATPSDVAAMLEAIGVPDVNALFDSIPKRLQLNRPLAVPEALSEFDLMRQCEALARLNGSSDQRLSFLGGGAYSHFIPSVVDMVISRSEFATAYTPYQAEVAQGTLQAIFQMQTYVCELYGMEVANASNYEGASSLAEAALMSLRMRRRYTGPRTIFVSLGVHPDYRAVLKTYLKNSDIDMVETPLDPATGATDFAALAKAAEGGALATIVQSPNYLGVVEDLAAQRAVTDAADGIMIVANTEPTAFGLIKPPGAFGADIVAGEGQALGIPLSFGGPYCGLFAGRMKDLRAMPGRLVGETKDLDGARGFVLTLSTREQHIRREKATSNICTNAGLMALAFTVYTSLVGKIGLGQLAELNLAKASFMREAVAAVPGLSIPFSGPIFNEFVVESAEADAATLLERLRERGILGGLSLESLAGPTGDDRFRNRFLMTVTETLPRRSLDDTLAALKEVSR